MRRLILLVLLLASAAGTAYALTFNETAIDNWIITITNDPTLGGVQIDASYTTYASDKSAVRQGQLSVRPFLNAAQRNQLHDCMQIVKRKVYAAEFVTEPTTTPTPAP